MFDSFAVWGKFLDQQTMFQTYRYSWIIQFNANLLPQSYKIAGGNFDWDQSVDDSVAYIPLTETGQIYKCKIIFIKK